VMAALRHPLGHTGRSAMTVSADFDMPYL
jgi:hypothetical protein